MESKPVVVVDLKSNESRMCIETGTWAIEMRDADRFDHATRAIVESVRLRKTWFPLRVVVRPSERIWYSDRGSVEAVDIDVALSVPNVRTGLRDTKPMTIMSTTCISVRRLRAEDFGQYVRALIMRALLHELDEQLIVDGYLLNDPHAHEFDGRECMPLSVDEHQRVLDQASVDEEERYAAVFAPLRSML